MTQQNVSQDWVLVADIGGTNARFSAVFMSDTSLKPEIISIATGGYPDFITAAETLIPQFGAPQKLVGMVLAIAGPVDGTIVRLTNAEWIFDAEAISQHFSVSHVRIINDFTAISFSIPQLMDQDYITLQSGVDVADSHILVVGPGTGLGVGGLFCASHGHYLPIVGEGGHTAFAPQTNKEWFVFNQLKEIYGNVSYEHIVSGSGLINIAKALGAGENIQLPEHVTDAAIQGRCAACMDAVHIFLSALGRICGDITLTIGASSGVYLAGGILPKLYNHLDISSLLTAFLDKGHNRQRLMKVPVRLITRPDPAFLGLRGVAHNHFFTSK